MAVTTPSSGTAIADRAGYWAQTLRWLNALPVAGADVISRPAGQGAHVPVSGLLANDGDGDWDKLVLLSVSSPTPAGGLVLRDGPWIIYLPPSGGGGTSDLFTYQVGDGRGGVATGAVTIQLAVPPVVGGGALAIRTLSGPPPVVEVRFQGIAGRTYRVQTASSAAGPWASAGDGVADATGVMLFTEAPQPQPRFFRIVEP